MTENIKESIEDKIIDAINSSVKGRLVIFKPEEKGMEDYLVIERRAEYKEDKIYLQVNSLVLPSRDSNFVKEFNANNFKADKNYYLIFVYFEEATQQIEDFVWLVPSLVFKDIAQIIKTDDGRKILKFESSVNIKNKNQYSRFLIKTKDLGKIILKSLKEKKQIDFEGDVIDERKPINLNDLSEFLCIARGNTFAAGLSGVDNPRLLGSKQFEFGKGNYFYRDIYFTGDKNIIGQEIIYLNSEPIWGMNYDGMILDKLSEKFLQESLTKLSEKCRMGINCNYEKREYKYEDVGKGDLREFSGQEKIFVNNKEIYHLNYKGGLISEKQ